MAKKTIRTKTELAKANWRDDSCISFRSEGELKPEFERNDHEVQITATDQGEIWLKPAGLQKEIDLMQALNVAENALENSNEAKIIAQVAQEQATVAGGTSSQAKLVAAEAINSAIMSLEHARNAEKSAQNSALNAQVTREASDDILEAVALSKPDGGVLNAITGVAVLTRSGKKLLGIKDNQIQLVDDGISKWGWGGNTQKVTFVVDESGIFAGIELQFGDILVATDSGWKRIPQSVAVGGVRGSQNTTFRNGLVTLEVSDILTPEQLNRVNRNLSTNQIQDNEQIHAGHRDNPHIVTAAQVGARPNTWMPTAAQVGARPSTWMPTAADVGARPSTWIPSAAAVGAIPNQDNIITNAHMSNGIVTDAHMANGSVGTRFAANTNSVPAATSLNTVVVSGIYRIGNASANRPITQAGNMLVMTGNNSMAITQEYVVTASTQINRRFSRASHDGGTTWSAWSELVRTPTTTTQNETNFPVGTVLLARSSNNIARNSSVYLGLVGSNEYEIWTWDPGNALPGTWRSRGHLAFTGLQNIRLALVQRTA